MDVNASAQASTSRCGLAVTLALTGLLIYSLRVFTRGRLVRSFAIDDGLMVLAAVRSKLGVKRFYIS